MIHSLSIRKDSLSALSGPNFPFDDSTNRPGKLQILWWSEGGSDGRMMAGMQVTSLDNSAMGSNGVAKGDCVILRFQCILTLSQLTTYRKQFLPRGSVGSPAFVNMFTPRRFVYVYIHIEYLNYRMMIIMTMIMIRIIIYLDSCFRMLQVSIQHGTTNIVAKRDRLLLIHFLY